jgi:hypothetical protein
MSQSSYSSSASYKALEEFSAKTIAEKNHAFAIRQEEYKKLYAEREIRFRQEAKQKRVLERAERAEDRRYEAKRSALLARLQLELDKDAGKVASD